MAEEEVQINPKGFQSNTLVILKSSGLYNKTVKKLIGHKFKLRTKPKIPPIDSISQRQRSWDRLDDDLREESLQTFSWASFIDKSGSQLEGKESTIEDDLEKVPITDMFPKKKKLENPENMYNNSFDTLPQRYYSQSTSELKELQTNSFHSSSLPYLKADSESHASHLHFSQLTVPYPQSRGGNTSPPPELSAAHNLKPINGQLVSVSLMKDEIIDILRKAENRPSSSSFPLSLLKRQSSSQEQQRRGTLIHYTDSFKSTAEGGLDLDSQTPLQQTSSQSLDSMKDLGSRGDRQQKQMIEENPKSPVKSSSYIAVEHDHMIGEGKKKVTNTEVEHSQHWKSIMSSTSRNKVASIVRLENDYCIKWMKMKKQRDQERNRILQREKEKDLIHTFQRVLVHAEK
jgi:hypothetical protein